MTGSKGQAREAGEGKKPGAVALGDVIRALKGGDAGPAERWLEAARKVTPRSFNCQYGGCLTVTGRKRESGSLATVAPGNEQGEVALSRAMFNSRRLHLRPEDGGPKDEVHEVLSFEAPLLRLSSAAEGVSRSAACDLVTMASDPFRLTAVEVKCRASERTDLEYGLVEAWLYGLLLAMRIGGEDGGEGLKDELRFCRRLYLNQAPKRAPKEMRTCQARFALAGPRDYFAEQLKLAEKNNGSPNPEQLREHLLDRCDRKWPELGFDGFWVLSPPEGGKGLCSTHEIQPPAGGEGTPFVIPMLRDARLTRCPDLGSLRRLLAE